MPLANPTDWLIETCLRLHHQSERGALFGFGQGQVALFAVLSVVALLGILYWLFVKGAADDLLLTVALGSVCAGILGNLYDRLGLPGLKWDFPPTGVAKPSMQSAIGWISRLINWPIFNIADSLLVCGAGLLIWHAFRAELNARSGPAADAPAPSSRPESTAQDSVAPKSAS